MANSCVLGVEKKINDLKNVLFDMYNGLKKSVGRISF